MSRYRSDRPTRTYSIPLDPNPGPAGQQVASTGERHGHARIPDLAGRSHPAADGRALCHGHGHDPALWFDETKAGHGRERAKAICGRCSVRMTCLAYARDARHHTTVWGVWGGVYFTDRRSEER